MVSRGLRETDRQGKEEPLVEIVVNWTKQKLTLPPLLFKKKKKVGTKCDSSVSRSSCLDRGGERGEREKDRRAAFSCCEWRENHAAPSPNPHLVFMRSKGGMNTLFAYNSLSLSHTHTALSFVWLAPIMRATISTHVHPA